MLLALLLFVATLTLVIWQPRGLGIGWSALGGAAVALLVGVIKWSDVPAVWHIVWNATLAFVAVVIISLLLDEAGFFEWAALHVTRWGGGRGRWLFPLVVLLGAAISAVFANDGAALILTPIVIEMLQALGFGPAASLAFVMATGFVADTASLPLVVSNLVNIVSADYFRITFDAYARVMVVVDLAAIAATLAVLYAYFRKHIPSAYDPAALKAPAAAIRDAATFHWGWGVLGLLLVGYFASGPLGIPVSAVAVAGALVLAAVAGRWFRSRYQLGVQAGTFGLDARPSEARIDVRRVLREAPWQIVFFSLGMYLVVYGLRNAGLTHMLAQALDALAAHGFTAAVLGTGFLTAFMSSLMNNMPTVLIGALAIHGVQGVTPAVREAMVYANVIGADLGPKITPIGSLATLLWLHVLARKGMRIGWGTYFRIGIVLTLPVLLVTLLTLAGWLAVVG